MDDYHDADSYEDEDEEEQYFRRLESDDEDFSDLFDRGELIGFTDSDDDLIEEEDDDNGLIGDHFMFEGDESFEDEFYDDDEDDDEWDSDWDEDF